MPDAKPVNEQSQSSAFSASETLWRSAIVVTLDAKGDTIRSFVHLPAAGVPAIVRPVHVPEPVAGGTVPAVVATILGLLCALTGAALTLAIYRFM